MPLSREEALQRVSSQSGLNEAAARALRAVFDDVYTRLMIVEAAVATAEENLSILIDENGLDQLTKDDILNCLRSSPKPEISKEIDDV